MAIVEIDNQRVDVPSGSRLAHVCARNDLPVVFGCRAGRCGACLVQVIDGPGNLIEPTGKETRLLEVLAAEQDWRLACQCVVVGDVKLRYV